MKKTTVELLDDTDGSPADETVELMIDGDRFELDLSDKNATKLRDQLEPWKKAARRTSEGVRRRRRRGSDVVQPDKSYNDLVRDWARKNGHRVSSRGRIATHLVQAFEAEKNGH